MKLLIPITLLLCPTVLLQAASIQWHTSDVPTLYWMRGSRCVVHMGSTHVQISYEANAVTDAGVQVCGQRVLKGTRLKFTFRPHVFTDIAWNGTGYSSDSPYGAWVRNAGPSAGADFCDAGNYIGGDSGYAALSVSPPSKNVQQTVGFGGCTQAGSDRSCTAARTGTWITKFEFSATVARFYKTTLLSPSACSRYDRTGLQLNTATNWYHPYDGTGWQYCGGVEPYTLHIPAATIECPIEIIEPSGTPPTPPTIQSSDDQSCTALAPASMSLTASDPDTDAVRFGVDWNGDGNVDEFVPSSASIPSGGTALAAHTFGAAGKKIIRAYSEDERLARSAWSTITIDCKVAPSTDLSSEILGGGDVDDEQTDGLSTDAVAADGSASDLSLRAMPSLVRSGTPTKLYWSASNMTSCTVSAPNGDSWNTRLSPVGGQTSRPIRRRVVYTLSCLDENSETFTKSVTVNTLPLWREI